jgi:hypothetical protein
MALKMRRSAEALPPPVSITGPENARQQNPEITQQLRTSAANLIDRIHAVESRGSSRRPTPYVPHTAGIPRNEEGEYTLITLTETGRHDGRFAKRARSNMAIRLTYFRDDSPFTRHDEFEISRANAVTETLLSRSVDLEDLSASNQVYFRDKTCSSEDIRALTNQLAQAKPFRELSPEEFNFGQLAAPHLGKLLASRAVTQSPEDRF